MKKRILSIVSCLAVLGVAYADELPLLVSLTAALFLGVEVFLAAASGTRMHRCRRLFGWQLTEVRILAVIVALLAGAALVIGPSLGILYLAGILCSAFFGFVLQFWTGTQHGR